MLGPLRSLVPTFPRYDVGVAVAVYISDSTGLVTAQVQRVLAERDFIRNLSHRRRRQGARQ